MFADTEEELHAMALAIGMKRAWFQVPKNKVSMVHYDLVASRRKRAVRLGAVEVDRKWVAAKIRERMDAYKASQVVERQIEDRGDPSGEYAYLEDAF
jgi:hypothetical protein